MVINKFSCDCLVHIGLIYKKTIAIKLQAAFLLGFNHSL